MILVTGASGFLGSHICRQLIEEKRPFIALKRSNSNLSLLADLQDQITWHDGDILDIESLDPIMKGIDTVIHSAAVVSFHRSDFEMMDKVNIEGTRNLINSCITHQVEKFIHVSSVAALGRNKPAGEIDETNKWQESKWNTAYGKSKYLAELEVWRGLVEGLNAVIINPSVILGPGDWNRSSSTIFKYVWKEQKFFTDGLVNYVDVRDVTAVVSKLLKDTDKYGERYILSAGAVSFGELFTSIAKRFDKKAPTIKASHPVVIELGIFSEWLRSKFTGKKPMVTRETAQMSNNQIYFSNAKVVNQLNHTFAGLDETLDWVCSFYGNSKK